MSASFDADTAELERLRERLDAIKAELPDLYEMLADEGHALVGEQFDRQGGPDGGSWPARDDRFGRSGGQTMRNTRAFEHSFVARPTSDGFEVGSGFVGARVLTQGAVIRAVRAKRLRIPLAGGGFAYPEEVTIPARPVIPTGDAGPIWTPRLLAVINDFAADVLEAS